MAIVYTQLNRLRTRLARAAKDMGYELASYVSKHAFVGPKVTLGEHCFIFESNVVQPFVTIGDNVVLWSGNHIGHHSKVRDNVFVSSHVVISGISISGRIAFRQNAAVADNITMAKDCWIGPGVVISKNTKEGELYRSPEAEVAKVSAPAFLPRSMKRAILEFGSCRLRDTRPVRRCPGDAPHLRFSVEMGQLSFFRR